MMDKIIAFLKKLFPKPNIPQKRYMVMVGIGAYCLLKLYVWSTPTTADDALPDQLRSITEQLLGDNEDY